jgi:hypothetical protein
MSSVGNARRNARKRNAPATRRRALELLASCRDGCTDAIMFAHGFTVGMMVELVNAGLASASTGAWSLAACRWRLRECGLRKRGDGRWGVAPSSDLR